LCDRLAVRRRQKNPKGPRLSEHNHTTLPALPDAGVLSVLVVKRVLAPQAHYGVNDPADSLRLRPFQNDCCPAPGLE
jgi:hypothetical protein